MTAPTDRYRPQMTHAGLSPTHPVTAMDEYGQRREVAIAGERPLTLYLDRHEVVTLMTLGGHPEALALGYLRNQGFLQRLDQVQSVQVDWEVGAVVVTTHDGAPDFDQRVLGRRTVTTGCGQGTIFGDLMNRVEQIALPQPRVAQSLLYALLRTITEHNEVYRAAGAVHGCGLCRGTEILYFAEDVGRHNAVDAIAGLMWLDGVTGDDKLFYTTGRLTSEMVIKVAQMGVPVLLSRSGITRMGLEVGQKVGVTMIGRATGQHFLVYNGAGNIDLDAVPAPRPPRSAG